MKIHAQALRGSFRTPARLGWLLLLPALATSFSAQAVEPEMDIECGGDGTAVITCRDSSNEWIVVSSSSLAGPWKLRLEPVISGSGSFQMTVSATNPCEYFRLAPGQRFVDDFEDGNLEGWAIIPENPQLMNHVTVAATNGQLHIQGSPPAGVSRRLLLVRTNMLLTDLSAQIDILGWDDTAGNQPVVGLLGRVDPRVVESPPVAYFYMGGTAVAPTDYPGQSSLWTWKKGPDYDGLANLITVFGPRMQPSTNYHMVLEIVDNAETPSGVVRLLDDNWNFIAQNTAIDNGIPLNQGLVGIYIHEQSVSGTVDFWLDNFVAVGTTP